MQPINKKEMDYLILKGALKQTKGNYKDFSGDKKIVVIGKYSNKSRKQRYAPTPLFNKLTELKFKEKLDLDSVKHNQKYLYSVS